MPMEKMLERLTHIPEGFEYVDYTPQMVSEAIGSHRSNVATRDILMSALIFDGNDSIYCVDSPSSPRLSG
jgi:hypothetical protein